MSNVPESFHKLLLDNERHFTEYLDAVARTQTEYGQYDHSSIRIDSLEIDNQGGTVSIVFDYTDYRGCSDLDINDEYFEDWEFKLIENHIEFTLEFPPSEREDEI